MAEQLHYRNLSVPFLSQRKNTYVFKGIYEGGMEFDPEAKNDNDHFLAYNTGKDHKEVSMANRSCNITCIAMILHYFGIKSDTSHTPDTPDKMMEDYFTSPKGTFDDNYAYKSVMAFESWKIMEDFVLKAYATKCTTKLYDEKECTIQDLKDNIAAGYPVMMSIGSVGVGTTSGHIVVVRGFTKIGSIEYIILNDPWGSPADINNELVKSETGNVYAYYNTKVENNGSNGDNVVLKVSEFKKMIVNKTTIHRAMVIYANLWQKPKGAEHSDIDAVFPMNADFMWHSGIHLSGFSPNKIRSIGAGRLLAVRNSDAINGSASFMLVKHQVAKLEGTNNGNKVGKILPFYALYMHTDSINIKICADKYFKTGRLPKEYNFKWLLQLFSSMLPHVYVIANENYEDPETDGLMNTDYTSRTIFYADIGGLGLTRTLTEEEEEAKAKIEVNLQENPFHGRRMLIHLLPVNGLFQKLLDPANYSNSEFQKEMLDSSNFVKEVTTSITIEGKIEPKTTKYIFFHKYDAASTDIAESTESEIFYSKVSDTSFFEKPITVNGKVFRRNAKILSMLYNDGSEDSGKVVSFNDLVNLPIPRHISLAPITYLNGKAHDLAFTGATTVTGFLSLSGTAFRAEQKAHWKKIFGYRIENTDKILSITDNFFTGMEDISLDLALLYKDSKDSNASIYNRLNEYFKQYHLARCEELFSFLTVLSSKNAESDANGNQNVLFGTWRYHLRTTLNDCFYKITPSPKISDYKPPFANVKDDTGDGDVIVNVFVGRLEEFDLPLGYAEIAIEMACCRLCNIPQNKIAPAPDTTATCFTTADGCINALLERYSSLLTATFNSFNMSYQHYVDTIIEISKNDVIGKSGRYNEEKNMIHFEIFSPKKINIYTELGIETKGSIVDQQKGRFFDPSHIIKTLKEHIPEEDKIDIGFGYLIKNIILYSEFLKLKGRDIFSTYTFNHISEWSQTLTFTKFLKKHSITLPLNAYIREDEEIKPFHVQLAEPTDESAATVEFKDKWYSPRKYFEECAVPYHWSLEKILGKIISTNGFYIYYNPAYFLDQLMIKDIESRDLHESEDA